MHLTEQVIQSFEITGRQYDKWDDVEKGLLVRVNATGTKTYMAQYARGRRKKIARFGEIPLKVARHKAKEIIVSMKNNVTDTNTYRTKGVCLTYKEYLDKFYYPRIKETHRSADIVYQMLNSFFVPLCGNTPISNIDPQSIEDWKRKRLKMGITKATINRNLATFKASVNDAVETKLLTANPVASVKLYKKADNERSRYLTGEERDRFFTNLSKFPLLFQTVVKISIFSGLRRKETLTLEWRDIRYPYLTVRNENAKNGVSRNIPINKTLHEALTLWREKTNSPNSALLFFNPETGERFHDFRKNWARLCKISQIEDFRWHDMRHEFATSLLRNGVELYTIQKLLGHLDSDMTKRYTHIADKMLVDAVARLD